MEQGFIDKEMVVVFFTAEIETIYKALECVTVS